MKVFSDEGNIGALLGPDITNIPLLQELLSKIVKYKCIYNIYFTWICLILANAMVFWLNVPEIWYEDFIIYIYM